MITKTTTRYVAMITRYHHDHQICGRSHLLSCVNGSWLWCEGLFYVKNLVNIFISRTCWIYLSQTWWIFYLGHNKYFHLEHSELCEYFIWDILNICTKDKLKTVGSGNLFCCPSWTQQIREDTGIPLPSARQCLNNFSRYAVLDMGTNYCNLRNLVDGSG